MRSTLKGRVPNYDWTRFSPQRFTGCLRLPTHRHWQLLIPIVARMMIESRAKGELGFFHHAFRLKDRKLLRLGHWLEVKWLYK